MKTPNHQVLKLGLLLLCAISTAPKAVCASNLPQIFAPGVVSGPSNDGSPTFSPSGGELYFTRSAAQWSVILKSTKLGERWSDPTIAPFSGKFSDSSPALSPNGAFIIFVSVRPEVSDEVGSLHRKTVMGSHVWRSKRTPKGWSEPEELPATVNFCRAIFRPSVANDGSIYFTAAGQGKELSLFRSRNEAGVYQKAEPLAFSDGKVKDVDPEIAPDQSFLIFTSKGRGADASDHERLFIVHRQGNGWGPILRLRYSGDDSNGGSEDDDARLGPDQITVYFSSDRTIPVHWPRSSLQAKEDLARLQSWDNGNLNVWSFLLPPISG